MVRLEKYKEADESELSELSEPGGGAGTLVVWRTLCDYGCQGTFLRKNEGSQYMALLVNE